MTTFSKFKKIILALIILIFFAIQPIQTFAQPSTDYTINSIDQGIGSLNYNKYEILENQGDRIESIVPKEAYESDGKFIVLEHKKRSLGTSPVDVSVVDSIIDRVYPGSILLADEAYIKNRPTPLLVKRKPMTLSIDLPGLGTDSKIVVDNPTYTDVNSALNEIIDKWSDENSETHTVPARTQYNETMVYSKNQLKMGLNVDINIVDQLLGIDFEAISKCEQKYMVASYKQIFYTVSAELPTKPSDLFDDNVTFDELTYKGVSNDTPPVLVSNVAYGRTIYVVLKTNSQSDKVETAFKALIKGQKIEAGTELEDIIENSSFSVVVLGGDAQEHNNIITTDFQEIRRVIKDNACFSLKNPGYPISYTTSFLKDNSLAAVHSSTDYIETKVTEYESGKITLDHSGAYVAEFYVSWDEASYDDEGNELLTHKEWDGNGKNRTAHYSTVINLPPNAKNIKVKAKECTGLAWEWWRTVVDEVNIPLTKEIKVAIWGTTLHPRINVSY
ncbi:thiol-activated cytolysin family protein [Clostridiaceae bacterium M8S5]|nr:thiol-activated cytolysin family protein [Clostridiaceae bacterium M8S5]